jgi:hypothetical protein
VWVWGQSGGGCACKILFFNKSHSFFISDVSCSECAACNLLSCFHVCVCVCVCVCVYYTHARTHTRTHTHTHAHTYTHTHTLPSNDKPRETQTFCVCVCITNTNTPDVATEAQCVCVCVCVYYTHKHSRRWHRGTAPREKKQNKNAKNTVQRQTQGGGSTEARHRAKKKNSLERHCWQACPSSRALTRPRLCPGSRCGIPV